MKRLFAYFCYFLSTLIALILVAAMLLMTPSVNLWLLNKGIMALPGLHIQKLDGYLLTGLRAEGITFQNETLQVRIDSLNYHFQPAALLQGTIQFKQLAANGVDIALFGGESDSENSEGFLLPLAINVKQLNVTDISYRNIDALWRIDKLNSALQLVDDKLTIEALTIALDETLLKAHGDIQLSGSFPFTMALIAEGEIPELGRFQGDLQIEGDSSNIQFSQQLLQPFLVSAAGEVILLDEQPVLKIQGNWQQLQWPLTGSGEYVSDKGEFSFNGALDRYKLTLQGVVKGAHVPETKFNLQGAGDKTQLYVTGLLLKLLQGEIQGQGQLQWQDNVSWMMHVNATGIATKSLFPDFPAVVNLETDISGEFTDGVIIAATMRSLNGTLNGNLINGKGDFRYQHDRLEIQHLQLNIAENQLTADGRLGDDSHLGFKLEANDLTVLDPDLSGHISAAGIIKGKMQQPLLSLKLNGRELRWATNQIESIRLNAELDMTSEGNLSAQLQAEQLRIEARNIHSLQLSADGSFSEHRVKLSAGSVDGNLELALNGNYQAAKGNWQGIIDTLKMLKTQAGDWVMDKPTPLDVLYKADTIQVNAAELCVFQVSGPGKLCILPQWDRVNGQRVKGSIARLPLSVLAFLGSPQMALDSELSADFSIQFGAQIFADLQVSATAGTLLYKVDDERYQVPFLGMDINAKLEQDKLKSTFSVLLNKQDSIRADVVLNEVSLAERARIDSNITVLMTDLGFINAFDVPVSEIQGRLQAEITLSGELSQPHISVRNASLSDASFFVPELGISLAKLQLYAKQQNADLILLNGGAELEGKFVLLEGRISQLQRGDPELQSSIRGQDLKVAQLPEAEIWASPDLIIVINQHGMNIKGKISIPKANFTFAEIPENAVTVSKDEVIISQQSEVRAERAIALKAHIDLQLGDAVFLNGFGLLTRLQGNLSANYDNNRFRLFNELNLLDGTYQAYGQELKIDKGQLIFSGPADDPGINLLASRAASQWDDKVVAYFKMTGTLNKPETSIYTKPAKSESEAIAYLLTGGPLDKSDSNGTALLAKAALALGKDYVGIDLGAIGIEQLEIKSTSVGESSMVVGTRVAPKLFVRYIMDVITAQMLFVVEYKLTENLSIEAKSGQTHGGDIKYSIEFD